MDAGFFIKGICIDLNIKDGDLESDDGLETAVLISLYTDKRATQEEVPFGQSSRRGWWGDMFPDVDNDQIGSKLWTIDNEKQLLENIPIRENIISDALGWLVEDGVASDVAVVSSYPERGQVLDQITITRPSGDSSRFDVLWDGQELKVERF